MLIVSQDKSYIANFHSIETIGIDKCNGQYDISCTYNDGDSRLGRYKTEERAKEVLEEIIKQNAQFSLFKNIPLGGKEQAEMLEDFTKSNIILDSYQMPLE